MSILITGVAGFIGCNLAKRLTNEGHIVVGVDNLSRGALQNLSVVENEVNFHFIETDCADMPSFLAETSTFHQKFPITEVWHLAANSDIPAGVSDATVDLKDTFMTTFNVLEVMKTLGIKVLAFASSSAVYGDHGDQSISEVSGPLLPLSNYGAMKLASEAAISAAAESFLTKTFIYRFPNVIGVPATHGVLLDFVNKLKANPNLLNVLGNGTQQKAYLHVDDLIEGMLQIQRHATEKVAVYNLGAEDEGISVRSIAEAVVARVSPRANIVYGVENRGWVGDVPKFQYCLDKLRKLGWTPELDSTAAIKRAIADIVEQEITKK
jgi:UDP-glucose 4-epimerase